MERGGLEREKGGREKEERVERMGRKKEGEDGEREEDRSREQRPLKYTRRHVALQMRLFSANPKTSVFPGFTQSTNTPCATAPVRKGSNPYARDSPIITYKSSPAFLSSRVINYRSAGLSSRLTPR